MQDLAAKISAGIAILTLAGIGSGLQAQTNKTYISYTSRDLGKVWTQTTGLTDSADPTSLYKLFEKSTAQATPTGGSVRKANDPKCRPPEPDEDKIIPPECNAPPPQETKAVENAITVFGIFPLKDEQNAAAVIRLQGFQKYYAAHQEYALYRTDENQSATSIADIEKRERYALSDLLMLNARLYYAAPTSAQKCSYIKRVASLYQQYSIRFGDQPFVVVKKVGTGSDETLQFSQDNVLDVLKKEFAEPHVCNFVLQGSRSKQQELVVGEASRLFIDKVVAEVNTYTNGVNEAGNKFATLKASIGPDKIDIRTKAILDYERDLLNLESNLKLVANDEFKVAQKLADSKRAEVGGGSAEYSYAGCGYLATVTDYFEQAFDLEPFKLEDLNANCVATKTVAKQKPAKGLGSSPEVLNLAKRYITEASFAATGQIEQLLQFVDDKVLSRADACPNNNCFPSCKKLKPSLQKAPGSDRSILAMQLAPLAPGAGNTLAVESQRQFFSRFKTDFDACMGELQTYLAIKKDHTVDQKFQSEFSKELKRFNSFIK